MPDPVAGWTGAVLASIVVVELLRAMPLFKTFSAMRLPVRKSFAVIAASRISDHWKERALRAYAGASMRASAALLAMMLALAAGYGVSFVLAGLLAAGDFDAVSAMTSLPHMAGAMIVSIGYWTARRRIRLG